jgi:hypothetical protein
MHHSLFDEPLVCMRSFVGRCARAYVCMYVSVYVGMRVDFVPFRIKHERSKR